MNTVETDTLILGATFRGCGLARRMPDAILVEPSIAPGSDYVFGFEQGTDWTARRHHPEAEELRSELLKRHALTPEGRLLNGALAPVLSDWCLRRGIYPELGLEPIELHEHTALFSDLCGSPVAFRFRRLIDARTPQSGSKSITASVYSDVPLPEGCSGSLHFAFTGVEGLYTIRLSVPENCSWQVARRELFLHWMNRSEEYTSARLQLIGCRFSRSLFANAVAALEAGLNGDFEPVFHLAAPERTEEKCDVFVAGLGTAGCSAAVAAARRGARVIAIERNTYPGGTWTGGFLPKCYIQKPAGLLAEFYEEAARIKGFLELVEPLKIVQERAALEAGADIRYGAVAYGTVKTGNRISAVRWRDSSGVLHTTRAEVVIDASAEAAVCRISGCELRRGRPSDGEGNPYTNSMGTCRKTGFGVANNDAGRITQDNRQDFSRSYLAAFLRHLVSDFRVYPVCIQPSDLPGVREGARIIPENPYTIGEFLASGGNDPEPLFRVYSNVDTHTNDLAFEPETFQDWTIAASLWNIRLSIPLPRRILFPRGVSGLIAAGRHHGVDHELACALRMIPGMAAEGEAAGIIAARSVERNTPPDKLPYREFAGELPQASDADPALNRAWHAMPVEEIRRQMKSVSPGLAIWNAVRQKRNGLLNEWLEQAETGSAFRAHCAIALALLNETSAIPVLLELAEKRDAAMLNPGLNHAHSRGVAAVYLLGRLRAVSSVPLLADLLQNAPDYEFRTHALASLLKIGDAYTAVRSAVAAALRKLAEDPGWVLTERLNGTNGRGTHRADGLFRLHAAHALDRWAVSHRIAEVAAALPMEFHQRMLWQNYEKQKEERILQ